MTGNSNNRGYGMGMSPEWASFISLWANWVLVASLVVGVIATYLLVVAGGVKESALEVELSGSRERIALLEKETAEANRRAEEDRLARLKLEARIAPRSLTQDEQHAIAKRLSQFDGVKGSIVASPATAEAEWLARVLAGPLLEAGWDIKVLPGIPTATVLHPKGVVIQYEWHLWKNELGLKTPGPWLELANALNELGIEATALPQPMESGNTIKIIINER